MFPTGFEPVNLESHLAGWTHRPKARTSCQYRRCQLNHRFPGYFFTSFFIFLFRGRDITNVPIVTNDDVRINIVAMDFSGVSYM